MDFIKNDPIEDHPIMITIVIAGWAIGKVVISQGSSANILYVSTFEKLDVPYNFIKPHEKPLIGFAGEQVHTKGCVDLLTNFGLGKLSRSLTIPYISVDVDNSYNALLANPTLNVLLHHIWQ